METASSQEADDQESHVPVADMLCFHSLRQLPRPSGLSPEPPVAAYPVDLPCQDYDELNPGSCDENLPILHSDTHSFSLTSGEKVRVTHENIGHLVLFDENDPPHTLLALHTPADETQVVALYLHGKWWPISEVLKTSSKSRNGLLFVESVMERVVLFLLSQIIFGVLERPLRENIYFTHSVREHGKILWQDGEAVGFYTFKKKGSLCDGCTGQSYCLPVLDTVFVRTHWRRKGLALQMLQDFCTSMPNESNLGISCPISASLFGVCIKYLETHHEERERLYEVEAPGEWSQRCNVWLSIQLQRRQTHSASSDESPHTTQTETRNLMFSKSEVLEGIPQVDECAIQSTEATKPQKSGIKKQLTSQTGTTPKCKKAKTSL